MAQLSVKGTTASHEFSEVVCHERKRELAFVTHCLQNHRQKAMTRLYGPCKQWEDDPS